MPQRKKNRGRGAVVGGTASSSSDDERDKGVVQYRETNPTSLLERLPNELVHLISSQLPVESRIVLALTSHTMMSKMGGVGPGTDNIPTDDDVLVVPEDKDEGEDEDDEDDEDDDELTNPPPSSRMSLLALLERDALLLTLCDYCRKLHSPFWIGTHASNARFCGWRSHRVDLPLSHGTPTVTLPLVRAAVSWDRRGLDALSVLGGLCRSELVHVPNSVYRYLVDYKARVADGCVVVKHQLIVVRPGWTASRRRRPTAHDLMVLDHIFRAAFRPGWRPPGLDSLDLGIHSFEDMRKPECLDSCDRHFHYYACYRDKIGPSCRNMSPALRCLLTHGVPCARCKREETGMGRVIGSEMHFADYSIDAVDLGEDGENSRALVFTTWADLGTGASQWEPKWMSSTRDPDFLPPILAGTDGDCRKYRIDHGGRAGEAYEAYEKAASRAPYVPQLPRGAARRLLEPRPINLGFWG
ncbi:hypothetical protein VTK56DRAFT_3020 [Thermocarpiscus australiensis]